MQECRAYSVDKSVDNVEKLCDFCGSALNPTLFFWLNRVDIISALYKNQFYT